MAETGQGRTRREQRRAYWRSHVESWGRSGQSKQGYCREHGLKPTSFHRWCRQFHGQREKPLRLVPVRIGNGYAVELTLGNGIVMRIAGQAEPRWVCELARELAQGC
jgi:hypothetical protein